MPMSAAATMAPGTVLGATAWVVTRSLGPRRAGRMYEVRHQRQEGHWIVREIVPPPDMPPGEVSARTRDLARTVVRLRSSIVPGAAGVAGHFTLNARQYLVLEKVEGFTLDTAIRYRAEPLPRVRLLEWAASLARTLDRLADDGRWSAVLSATPEHLVVTAREELVLANPGLAREFLDGPAGDLGEGMRTYANTLLFMATGEARSLENVPPDLGWILARCLSSDPSRQYRGFGEVADALRALGAPAPTLRVVQAALEPVAAVPFEELSLLRRRLWHVAGAAGLVLALSGGLMAALHSWENRPLPPVASAVWSALDRKLAGIATASRSYFGSFELESPVRALAALPAGSRLLVALEGEKSVRVVDPVRGVTVHHVPTLGPSHELHLDPGGRYLFAVHPEQRAVGIIALLADEPSPAGLVTSESTQLTVAPLPGPAGARLAVASAGRLALYDVNPLKLVGEVPMPSTSALAPGPGGATLCVALDRSLLLILDARTLEEVDRRTLRETPWALVSDPETSDLWWISRDGDVGALRADGGEATLSLPGPALSMAFSGTGNSRILWVGLDSLVAAVDPRRGAVLAEVPLDGAPTAMSLLESH